MKLMLFIAYFKTARTVTLWMAVLAVILPNDGLQPRKFISFLKNKNQLSIQSLS